MFYLFDMFTEKLFGFTFFVSTLYLVCFTYRYWDLGSLFYKLISFSFSTLTILLIIFYLDSWKNLEYSILYTLISHIIILTKKNNKKGTL